MRGLADKAYAAGFNVVLLNQRNCGGTERLAAGLYHSGLTADADFVIRELAAVDGIERGEFPVRPEEPFLCTRCGYAGVCRKDYIGDE